MNKIIILIIGIFVMAGLVYALATFTAAGGNLRVSSLQKGLVGHWALDGESYDSNTERITDKTPYENHGTNYGATLTTDQMGQANRAMSFDGVDDYITFNPISLSNESATISWWMSPSQYSIDNGSYLFTNTVGDSLYSHILNNYAGKKLFIESDTNCNGPYWNTYYTKTGWHHWTVVFDNAKAYLYIDGVSEGEADSYGAVNCTGGTATSIVNNMTLSVIGYKGTYVPKFNGSISSAKIYNRALSADEIDTLYHSYRPKVASGSLQKGLVFDMPLKIRYTKDETAGSEIMTDRTPYSNDGQNNGSTVGSSYTDFDGEDDYVDCGDPADGSLDPESITIEMWLYLASDPNCDGNNNWRSLLHKGITSGTSTGYDIVLEQSRSIAWDIGNGSAQRWWPSGISIPIQSWTHLVVSYDSSTGLMRAYQDGVSKGSKSIEPSSIVPNANALMINNPSVACPVGSGNFNGSISSVKIYNRALSPSEIKLLYDKGR